jgi:hypothetical protein
VSAAYTEKKPSRFDRAPSTELQNTVTPDSIEVMCMFHDGQWPAQYGVQVIALTAPSALCARTPRMCSRARFSGVPMSFQFSVSTFITFALVGTTTLAPIFTRSSMSSTSCE